MGGDLVGDDAILHILFIWQTEVFLWRDIAEHSAAIPANHGSSDAACDVIVTRGDVGGKGAERVEGRLVAPFELLGHVLLDHVYRDMAGTFVHDLNSLGPGAFGELTLHFELAKLGFVVGIGHRTRTEPVTDGEADIIGGHNVADVIPMGVEEALLVMGKAPLRHDAATAANDAGHSLGCERDKAE